MNIPIDKRLHFTACAIVSAFVAISLGLWTDLTLSSMYGGICAGIALGVGKEYGDKKAPGNFWSWSDILADVCGSVSGSLFGLITLIL